jgi:branched-chain amino acid transport system ATP-binding protein
MESILKVDSISKSFGSLKAVDKISFEVEKGTVYGIAGPNGAGKTTLFNIISGIPYRSDDGTIFFEGQPIHRLSAHKICRLGLSRTFQRETAFESLTVAENIIIAAKYGGLAKINNFNDMITHVLETTSLTARVDWKAAHLSLYEKKRLMLATALVTSPKLLLLDEPASGLTAPEIDSFTALLQSLNKKGLTIMLIEHVLPLLLYLSQKVMILDYGLKLIEDVPDKVTNDPQVIEAYLGGSCLGS